MAVPAASTSSVRPTGTIFELEALEGMPCGCVAAAYRARPWDVAVVSLEAKGPQRISPLTVPMLMPNGPAAWVRSGERRGWGPSPRAGRPGQGGC